MTAGVIGASSILGGSEAAYRAAVLADSPWAYWPLKETGKGAISTVADSGSSGVAWNVGTNAELGWGKVKPAPNKAAGGPGSISELLQRTSVPASLASATAEISIDCWINFEGSSAKGGFGIIGSGGDGIAVGIGNTTFTAPGTKLIILRGGLAWVITTYDFAAGLHHVVLTRTSAGLTKVYVDGTEVYSATLTYSAATTSMSVGSTDPSENLTVGNVSFYASALSAARVTAHYNGGDGSDAAVAADNPVVWLKLQESNIFEDATPNLRHLGNDTTPFPTQGVAGARGNAIRWPASAGRLVTRVKPSQPSVATYECWFRATALPADATVLFHVGGEGLSGPNMTLSFETDGRIAFGTWAGSTLSVDTGSSVADGVWRHLVGSVGAAGMKLRVDKVTVGTNARTAATPAGVGRVWVRAGGPNSSIGTGAFEISDIAIWMSQLSNAQTDAHYNAA